jgi:uncharacterized membrane protein YtjA (UPF0391 family)
MIFWAAAFLMIALIAAVLGFSGLSAIAGVAGRVVLGLFVVGLVVAVVLSVVSRREV